MFLVEKSVEGVLGSAELSQKKGDLDCNMGFCIDYYGSKWFPFPLSLSLSRVLSLSLSLSPSWILSITIISLGWMFDIKHMYIIIICE
jgi:hypothetical protein